MKVSHAQNPSNYLENTLLPRTKGSVALQNKQIETYSNNKHQGEGTVVYFSPVQEVRELRME